MQLNNLFFSKESNSHLIYFISVPPEAIGHIMLFKNHILLESGDITKYGCYAGIWDMFKYPYKYHKYYRSIKSYLNDGKRFF